MTRRSIDETYCTEVVYFSQHDEQLLAVKTELIWEEMQVLAKVSV
jgi:hypothetical protein